jgi:uncharacterized protein YcaQ
VAHEAAAALAHRLAQARAIEELSADQARRVALWAQALTGAPPRGLPALLDRLGAIQLDTISTLARSHEVVAYSRLGAIGKDAVERAYWGTPPRAFEYWGHAACVIPLESWPWFAARRRSLVKKYAGRIRDDPVVTEVRRRLRDEGPMTVGELGGGRLGGGWWNWSPVKTAVERLFATGEVACVERRAWKRVYDLAERIIPARLLAEEPTDDECYAHLVAGAGERLGVATAKELGWYFYLLGDAVKRGLPGSGLVPVRVQGWKEAAWAHPAALETLAAGGPRGRHRTTLLTPFDNLLWNRPRVKQVFGFDHVFEAYVPEARRVHGYYTMPLLTGGRLRGRVDPGREGKTLVARQLSVDPGFEPAMTAALAEAAAWVGCGRVVLARVEPSRSKAELNRALIDVGLG